MIDYLLCCLLVGVVIAMNALCLQIAGVSVGLIMTAVVKDFDQDKARALAEEEAKKLEEGLPFYQPLAATLICGALLYVALQVVAFFLRLAPSIAELMATLLAHASGG